MGMGYWGRVWSKRPGKAMPRSKCDNAERTFAYTTKLEGLGKDCSAYKRVVYNAIKDTMVRQRRNILIAKKIWKGTKKSLPDLERTLKKKLNIEFQGISNSFFVNLNSKTMKKLIQNIAVLTLTITLNFTVFGQGQTFLSEVWTREGGEMAVYYRNATTTDNYRNVYVAV